MAKQSILLVLVLVLGVPIGVGAERAATVGFGSGMGFEGSFIDSMFVSVWTTKEERESPNPATSETPIDARQSLVAGVYEWAFDGVRVGIGVASIAHTERGTITAVVDGEPRRVPVQLRNDQIISPVASVGYSASSGSLWATARAMVSTVGVGWTAQAGWSAGTFRIGAGYVSAIGDDGVGSPMLTLGTSF